MRMLCWRLVSSDTLGKEQEMKYVDRRSGWDVQAYSTEDDDERVSEVEDIRYSKSEAEDHANDARPIVKFVSLVHSCSVIPSLHRIPSLKLYISKQTTPSPSKPIAGISSIQIRSSRSKRVRTDHCP
jgi:hypothetical protein